MREAGWWFTIFLLEQEISANVWKVDNRWEGLRERMGPAWNTFPGGLRGGQSGDTWRDGAARVEGARQRGPKAVRYPPGVTAVCVSSPVLPLCRKQDAAFTPGPKAEGSSLKRMSKLSGKAKTPGRHFGDLEWRSPHSDVWGALYTDGSWCNYLRTKPASHTPHPASHRSHSQNRQLFRGLVEYESLHNDRGNSHELTQSFHKYEQTPKEQQASEENQTHWRERSS